MVPGIDRGAWPSILRAHGFAGDGGAKKGSEVASAGSPRGEELSGEPIQAKLTHAPGNGADIGGLKVTAPNGWFAVLLSGTEDLCKIYAESLRSEAHLKQIQEEALQIVQSVFGTPL